MLDKKSTAVLKVLNKLSSGSAYKVITADEIIANLTQKALYDDETVKTIIDFLEKQEYLNIKFSEENTYCYSLLPKARIFLEQEIAKPTLKKSTANTMNYVYTLIASFLGTLLALLVFFCLTF